MIPDPDHPDRTVTASLGVAVARMAESGRATLSRADAACYRAKAGGRDRVESAESIDSVVGAGSSIIPRIRTGGGP
jgi:PleD family two-component response regulator